MAIRAEVGRVPRHRLRGRRGDLPPVPQRQAAEPLLPGGHFPARPLRDRWRAGDPRRRRQQEFDSLQMRLHPAESRVRRLAAESPATFVAFDLLALDDDVLMERPFQERRAELERLVTEPIALTPCTGETKQARKWLKSAEGVVAKEREAPYRPGERTGMVKIKRVRTIDSVAVGWRPGKEEGTVGSLILGLYDDKGELQVVGHTSGFRAQQKRDLVEMLAPYESGERGSATPAAGARAGTWSGSGCARSWWPRSPSTTPAAVAFATAPTSSAGGRTSLRRSARSTSSTAERSLPPPAVVVAHGSETAARPPRPRSRRSARGRCGRGRRSRSPGRRRRRCRSARARPPTETVPARSAALPCNRPRRDPCARARGAVRASSRSPTRRRAVHPPRPAPRARIR